MLLTRSGDKLLKEDLLSHRDFQDDEELPVAQFYFRATGLGFLLHSIQRGGGAEL